MKKVLINASNIKSGGAFQVSISFIAELSKIDFGSNEITLMLSKPVYECIKSSNIELLKFTNIIIEDNFGFSFLSYFVNSFDKYHVIFTIFGPFYFKRHANTKYITGFAQPWIVYPFADAIKKYNFFRSIFIKLKYKIQALFFSYSDCLIVETEDVGSKLSTKLNFSIPVLVVSNCISEFYLNSRLCKPLADTNIPISNAINICYVGSDYPHKNIDILPSVKIKLKEIFNLEVNFIVTFDDKEWGTKSLFFKNHIINVGKIFPSQCPSLYEKVDGVILPSLLECFSALPLEAMAMKRPFFGSNRGFITGICKNYGFYFDPTCAYSIAKTIFDYFENEKMHQAMIIEAYNYVHSLPNAKSRCLNYLSIIENI